MLRDNRPLMFSWDDITSAVSSATDTISTVTGQVADAAGSVADSLTGTDAAPTSTSTSKPAQTIPTSPQASTTIAKAGLSGGTLAIAAAAAYFLLGR